MYQPNRKTMLRKITRACFLFIILTAGKQVFAQCEPDTVNCKDTGDPGEFCPRNLPDATVNAEYQAVITVIPPASFVYQQQTLDIVYIVVDSVKNLPPGISYQANADQFYADSAYCILISGTPTTEGEYTLSLYVSPFITYLETLIKGSQVVDDTSVVMVVHGTSGLDPNSVQEFRVLNIVPNPFSEFTRMGFYTPLDDRIELKVFNILGELMHREEEGYPPGEYHFRFDGRELLPGTYFYRVSNHTGYHTGKIIKTR